MGSCWRIRERTEGTCPRPRKGRASLTADYEDLSQQDETPYQKGASRGAIMRQPWSALSLRPTHHSRCGIPARGLERGQKGGAPIRTRDRLRPVNKRKKQNPCESQLLGSETVKSELRLLDGPTLLRRLLSEALRRKE